MAEIFSALLDQLNSSVCVLIVILIVIVWSVYKLGALKEKFTHHEQRLDKADESHDLLVKLSTKVDFIYEFTNPRALARSQSPMALTDLGKEISDAIEAPKIFERYRTVLKANLESDCQKDAHAYDIQVSAFRVAREELPKLLTASEVNRLKQTAYENGIVLDDMWVIFGIMLRDDALAERGLSVSEIDKHAPRV